MRSGFLGSLIVLGVAAAGGLWLILSPREAPAQHRRTVKAPEVPVLVEQEPRNPAASHPPLHEATRPQLPVVDGSQTVAEQAPTREQLVFELQQKFETAPAPDAHAIGVERELARQLERIAEGGVELRSVTCRATICRAVMDFPSIDDDRASLDKLLAPMDGPVARFGVTVGRETTTTGAVTSTLFMSLR